MARPAAAARTKKVKKTVAKAIVRRASARAHTDQELYAMLANEIDDANDRKSFLRKVMSVSGRV